MGRAKELVFNTVIIGIGKFSTQVVSFLLIPLYTYVLSTQEYGIYDLMVTISLFVLPIITLLMEESMFRFLIDCKTDEEKRKSISQTVIYISIATVVFVLLYAIIVSFIDFEYKVLLCFYILANILVALRNSLARGLSKIKLFSIANFITSLITIILNIFFIVYLKIGVRGLLYSTIIANILSSVIVMKKLKLTKYISFKELDKKLMTDMIKYSFPLVPNSISWSIINVSDRIIISSFISTSANGIYSIANKFPMVMDSIYGFFYTSWKESAAKTLKDEDFDEFYNTVYDNLKRVMWSIATGMIACMPFVFNIFVKKEFTEAYKYIPLLIISIYFSNMSGYYGGIFSAYKSTKIMGITTVLSALINLIINLLFIRYIGIWAAVISTLISNVIVYEYRKLKLRKFVLLKENKHIFAFISLIITLYGYYSDVFVVQILCLIFIITYCVIINKNILINIKNRLIKKAD